MTEPNPVNSEHAPAAKQRVNNAATTVWLIGPTPRAPNLRFPFAEDHRNPQKPATS